MGILPHQHLFSIFGIESSLSNPGSMKKTAILLLVLCLANVYPQDTNDNLDVPLQSLSDTARIRVLKDLCWESRYTNPAEAMRYGLLALALVKQVKSYEFEATLNNYLGIIQRNTGDHAGALQYFFNALRIAENQKNLTDLAYSYNNIGDIYNLEEKYRKALEYESMALETFEELGDSTGVSYCCHQIALVYINMGEYSNSLLYVKRAMKIRESQGNRAGVAHSLISMGEIYLKLGLPDKSLESLDKSGIIFSEQKDSFGLSLALHSKGMLYKQLGEVEEAAKCFNDALEIGEETNTPIRIRNAAQELSEIYADQLKFREAYEMYILFKETYDTLYHEENLVKITQMVMQNEYEQRELVQLAEIERQKQFRKYMMLSFGLILILVLVILNRYYIKRRANIKLEKQKSELNNTLTELTQAQSQLVQSEKMASLGQLTAGVAHELNNPLNFITSSINPLQRNMDDLLALLCQYDSVIVEKELSDRFFKVGELKESMDYTFMIKETRALLKGISEGASRSEHIVKDLRTFSRMDENEFKGVNIHEGIDSTLLLLRNLMKDAITIHKNYGDIPPIECLPGKLNQVFMNILTNSVLAIEGKGDIFVNTCLVGENALISIRDTGKGMPPDVKEHIFEPFYTTRPVGKGTGLGLSISYSIIEEHNGKIEVISEVGLGSEFIITLPLIKSE